MAMPEPFHFRHDLRVRYVETDAQAVVYHANFLVYCDVARIEYLRGMATSAGRDEVWRDEGCDVVLVNANCDFRASARFDDPLAVWMRLAQVGSSSFSFAYRIERGETLVCEVKTVHVTIDRQTRVKRPLPDALKLGLPAYEAALAAAQRA
jgi:acyl-CoA thioester hydrolase